MGATFELREQDRIIYFLYEEPWSVDDIKRVNDEAILFLDKATEDMHILINVERIRHIPSGILRARNVPTMSHPRCAHIVICGASTFVRSLSETIFKVTRYEKAKFFNTEAEAMKFLREAIASAS
jgi:hypothetical protein